jgi:hypothetical protein
MSFLSLLLGSGSPVAGSPIDGTISNLKDMSMHNMVRHGYYNQTDERLTDRGANRMTTEDWAAYDGKGSDS